MTWKQGHFAEHLDVEGLVSIQGAVSGGATVRDGGVLVVQGALGGPLTIERGGAVSVSGEISCEEMRNEGLLMVSGAVAGRLPSDGTVLVSPGTVFADPPCQLMDDGTMRPLPENSEPITIDESKPRFRLTDGGRFEPHVPEATP